LFRLLRTVFRWSVRNPRTVGLGALALCGVLVLGSLLLKSGPADARAAVRGNTRRAAALGTTAGAALLSVRCHPWAVLYVDGRRVGNVPSPRPVRVEPGVHRLRLEAEGRPPVEVSIEVEREQHAVLFVDLESRTASLQAQGESR